MSESGAGSTTASAAEPGDGRRSVGDLVELAPPARFLATLRRLWPFLRPYPAQLLLIALANILLPALSAGTTWLFKVMIDDVIVPGNLRIFWSVAGGFAILALAQGVVSFTDHYLTVWTGERFALGLRSTVFRRLHQLTPDFFERRSLGDTVTRMNGDIETVRSLLIQVAYALNHFFLILFFGIAIFCLDWRLASASILVLPFIAVLIGRVSQRVQVASRERSRRLGSVGGVTEESLANVALVRAYDRADTEHAAFMRQNHARFAAQMISTRLQALFGPISGLVQLVGTLLVFGLAAWEIGQQHITIGGLLAFITYLGLMLSPLQDFGEQINSIFSATASAERVVELLDHEPTVRESPTPRPLVSARGVVRWRNVGFCYPGATHPTLSGIDLTALPGEKVAIVGGSGAGKSTMVKLMLRFYDPDAGSITLDGVDLRELAFHDLYRNVSAVLQETLVFDGTIRENISWGRPGANAADVVRAARAADAHGFVTDLADGYDTRVGQRGRLLSGGQRQRVAIARALIRDAPVLLLDEPTTGMDARTTHRVLASMRTLMAGRTTIIISHNLLTVTDADRILFLNRGVVVDSGSHEHLMATNAEYAALYTLHRGSDEVPVR